MSAPLTLAEVREIAKNVDPWDGSGAAYLVTTIEWLVERLELAAPCVGHSDWQCDGDELRAGEELEAWLRGDA